MSETAQAVSTVRPATNGQMKDMVSLAVQAVPSDLDFATAEMIGADKGSVIEEIRQVFLKCRCPLTLAVWREVYGLMGLSTAKRDLEFFKVTCLDMTELERACAEPKPGHWSIPVLKGATPNKVVAAIQKKVKVWTWTEDLDTAVTKNDRDPANGSYTISVLAEPEAKALADKSADMLVEEGVQGTTPLESLLLWLAYYMATGKYLDSKQVTLCSGSRYSGGYVPSVGWGSDDREVCVGRYSPDDRCGSLSARSVSQRSMLDT